MSKKKIVDTPLMKQYNQIKAQHPDAILLFRVGDFYETFSEDAVKTAEILGITLTKRRNGSASYIELAGFPHHALDSYLPKLVRAGQRVAICEQLEDPKTAKNVVKRGITELVTPGISVDDNILENKENNYLACLYFGRNDTAGAAFLDISTGEFYVAEGAIDYIDKLLNNLGPKEVLYERNHQESFRDHFGDKFYTYPLEEWMFTEDTSQDRLLKQFDTQSLKGFGVSDMTQAVIAAGAILHYLDMTHHEQIDHITRMSRIEEEKYVWLDKFTLRNLELLSSPNPEAKTLYNVLDKTYSPMGGRLLKRWISLPLKDLEAINKRLNIVETFKERPDFQEKITGQIKKIGDLERMVSKIALGRITPRGVNQLRNALLAIEPLKELCQQSDEQGLQELGQQLDPLHEVSKRIGNEIKEDPPNDVRKTNAIADGFSEELDELRHITYSGKDYLTQLQQKESERTGIPSLKVGFNNVFGYYFEVRNTHKDKVPEEWTRKQTLVSAERYINEELKSYESKILGAQEKIVELEVKLFNNLVLYLTDFIATFQKNAFHIARLDVLRAFAQTAEENSYTKPSVNNSFVLDISQGRHPVIEQQLPLDEEYVANDVYLDNDNQQIMIVTGPNMAGKSALLRQTALIVLMAQIGAFVPASNASIGYVDKVFTRVGASDNISLGESTFMVEMHEAASILNNISQRSLILFDELGRGTSTYDGISIAWAIVEYIHEHPQYNSKTLFATHYHELNEMERTYSRIRNFNVSVKDIDGKVIFLRKLEKGGSEHSFGIHVAKLAGMPHSVVTRANNILKELEETHRGESPGKQINELAQHREGFQLSFFQLDDPVLQQIRDEIANLDVNNLTPVEALNKLNEIKKISGA